MRRLLFLLIVIGPAAWSQTSASGCRETTAVPQYATIGDALTAVCITDDDIARAGVNLDSQITSYATLNDDIEFVIAYYDRVEGSDALKPPLHLLHFARRPKTWHHANLDTLNGSSDTFACIPCLGSAVSIHRAGGMLYVAFISRRRRNACWSSVSS